MARSVYSIILQLENDEKVKNALNSLGTAAGLTGAALTAFAAGAGKLAADYEQALASVATVSDETTGTTEEFSAALIKLQKEMGGAINIQEAAVASYDILSAGIKDQEAAVKALELSQKAAIVGQSDLNSISKAAVSVVNSYGESLGVGTDQADQFEKVINLITRTQLDGVITGGEYAAQIGNIASLANSSGISLEVLNAAIATSTAKGTPASQAFTRLNAVISNIAQPTANAQAEAEKLGITFDNAALQAQGLDGLLKSIFTADNFNVDTISNLFGSTEAQGIVQQLGSDLELLNENIERQTEGIGALDEAYSQLDSTPIQRVTNALNLLQSSLIQIGQGVLIAFEPVLTIIAKLASFVADLPAPFLAVIGAVAGLTGVALTAGGAVLVLATSLGGVKAALATQIPLLTKFTLGLVGMTKAALANAVALGKVNLALPSIAAGKAAVGVAAKGLKVALASVSTIMTALVVKLKAALAAMAPLLVTVAAFAGAAAAIGAVVDTLNKMDVQAKQNRESLKTLEENLREIKKESEGTTLEIASEESTAGMEKLNEEIGFVQRNLDRVRGAVGLDTALEAAANRGITSFKDLTLRVGEVENSVAQLFNLDGEILPGTSPEKIQEITASIDASIEALENSAVTGEENIILRDNQIQRLRDYKESLNTATDATEENTEATEDSGDAAELAAEKYQEYSQAVRNSIGNIQARSENAIAEISGSESRQIQETLRIRESAARQQIALLEDLKNQSQTSAEDQVAIEIEIQSKKIQLNKERAEANKKLEEKYNDFLRNTKRLEREIFENNLTLQNRTLSETYDQRLKFIQDEFNLEKQIIQKKIDETARGTAERRALELELAQLVTGKNREIAELNKSLEAERLEFIKRRFDAEKQILDFKIQAQDIESQILSNSQNALNSQAGILGRISGLLDDDNVTLGQRAELLQLAEELTGKTFKTNSESTALDQAQEAIQRQLALIELEKLNLKIKQLEIDREQLKIANEIRQLEIASERAQIQEQLTNQSLSSADRDQLASRDRVLGQQSELENRRTQLGVEGIESQLGFAQLERRIEEILTGNNRGPGGQLRSEAEQNVSALDGFSEVGNILQGEISQLRDQSLLTTQELERLSESARQDAERREQNDNKNTQDIVGETSRVSNNTRDQADSLSMIQSSQSEGTNQLRQTTSNTGNVAQACNSLVSVARSQLQTQNNIQESLNRVSRQLSTLPGDIASRLPRPAPPIPNRS